MSPAAIDPRIKILYLVAVAALAFASSAPAPLLLLLGLQIVLWLGTGLGPRALAASVRRLLFFIVFIVLSYALFGAAEGDRIHELAFAGIELPINLTGIGIGLLRSSRIVTIILASQIVQRSGEGKALVEGLRALRAPDFLAYGLDLVLDTLGPRRGGGGRGRRRKQERRQEEEDGDSGFGFRRLLRGDTSALSELVQRRLAETQTRAADFGLAADVQRDLVAVGGLAVVAMSLRFLKLMPGLPIAPGHKGIVLIPLYICAHTLTAARFGATRFGLVVGVMGFLTGMGKFGPFDILRHAAPGLFVDLVMPLAVRISHKPNVLVYGLVGVGAAAMRVASLVVAALVVEAPAAFYALLLPMTIAQMTFGMLSGFVTVPLLLTADRLLPPAADRGAAASAAPLPQRADGPS
ncbi:MAG: CbiQ family ECF transporter T component [Myxococcota bacterium]